MEDEFTDGTLYDAVFAHRDGVPKIRVLIGVPRRQGPRSFECKFRLEGLGDQRLRRVIGVDSLQCISIIAEFVRKCLIPLNVREEESDLPPELVLYRTLPTSYGLDFLRLVECQLDLELANKNLDIAEKVARNSKTSAKQRRPERKR